MKVKVNGLFSRLAVFNRTHQLEKYNIVKSMLIESQYYKENHIAYPHIVDVDDKTVEFLGINKMWLLN